MTDSAISFSTDTLGALLVPGIAPRWEAVQQRLHPVLAALADRLAAAASSATPRTWPLYDLSYRSLHFANRGGGGRAPIEEYHLAVDRPPRGSGVFIAVSGEERSIFVALQLGAARKEDLRRVWEDQRTVWEPLLSNLPEVRFAAERRRPTTDDRRPTIGYHPEADQLADQQSPPVVVGRSSSVTPTHWMDRYLTARSTYLLAGYRYAWDDPLVSAPEFADNLVRHVLELLPLNEAVMEQAEALDPVGAALLRERRASYALQSPPVDQIVAQVRSGGFAFSEATVRAYHTALQTRPLVILPGISGTGKTRLTKRYADAALGIAPGEPNDHYLLVAVQPDWHSARDLLGYYNGITDRFHPTPLLTLLARASADPLLPYFVCLDEMNLARPEYYLAPILAALETDERLVDLGAPGPTVQTVSGATLQNPFRLPLNVRITGTVNVDESAFPLSDKLLDRANVIELTEVDLVAFRATYGGAVDQNAWRLIERLLPVVTAAGHPFGYRTIAAILSYVEHAQGVMPPKQALDQQVKQKVLPKLRGDDTPRLRTALDALLDLLEPDYPESTAKLQQMRERLRSEGTTDFYG